MIGDDRPCPFAAPIEGSVMIGDCRVGPIRFRVAQQKQSFHQLSPTSHGRESGSAGKKTLEAFGSELKAFYLVLGRYDIVTISEAPDDIAAAKVALAIGSAGNVTTETLRVFTEDPGSG
jgi:hypothetical protein